MNELIVRAGQFSDPGRKSDNQDALGIALPDGAVRRTKGVVAAVADGISSAEHGREASETCISGFIGDYYSTPESWSVKESARQVLVALNNWLYSHGRRSGSTHHGALTTFSALIVKSTTAHIVHIGDSRICRIRDGVVERMTTEHRTWVSAEKNYLSRALGADSHIEIDYRRVAVEAGDVFLLTTDGVHDHVDAKEIQQLALTNASNLEAAAEAIARRALEGGSADNVSCQILRIERLPSRDPDEVFRELTELPFPPELSEGRQLDGFRIIRALHMSRRSELYLATDLDTGLRVVLKTPSVNYEDDPAYIERFTLEEWIGKRINNPHVVKVYTPTRRRRFLYHVTEYIGGRSLRQWMRDNPQPTLAQVRDIVEQIAGGLQSFHRMDMIHQDLKPENIMIDDNGTAKIVDFGSVRVAGIAEIESPVARVNLLGTRNYTAPEYAGDQPGSVRSDIFSLAVIAYEMLTGRLPYGEMPDHWQHANPLERRRYVPATIWNRDVPRWVDAALRKALQADPRRRQGVLSEFLYDFSHPNAALADGGDFVPLIARNPLAFWRGLAAVLALLCVILLLLLV